MAISKKVMDRISSQFKKYQSVLIDAKNRDISESDTVVIIADILADLFGYKKYVEITTEYSIRGSYVDLAVKVGTDLRYLIEAKAVGVSLKDAHIKQAVDYASNLGVEWVILTNGITWQIYKVIFGQPIDKQLIYELDFLNMNLRNTQCLECLTNLTREGFTHSSMSSFYRQQQATSKFSMAAILLTPQILQMIRRELRKVNPGVKIDEELIRSILKDEVLKREVVESDEAKKAAEYIKKSLKALAKQKIKLKDNDSEEDSNVVIIDTKRENELDKYM